MHSKNIVVSGINLFEGGPLSIYYDFLDALIECEIDKNNHVTAFVHKKDLFSKYKDKFDFIEIPNSRRSYLFRLFYEYVYFYFYSKKYSIDYWISLHDMTPNVCANNIYTYCHNPSPFYIPNNLDWKYSKKICVFAKLYKYIYGINIHKCTSIIVQQDWIREKFIEQYGISNVIVARPKLDIDIVPSIQKAKKNDTFRFIFASFPRTFKNFEVICEACRLLNKNGICGYEVLLTIDGTENSYSNYLYNKYKSDMHISWIGLQRRECLLSLYQDTDCMIFPSKLETWGLPISEYKATRKPIIVADLPYAHETIGCYEKVRFFNPNDAFELSKIMEEAIKNEKYYGQTSCSKVKEPFAEDWYMLCKLIFELSLSNDQ